MEIKDLEVRQGNVDIVIDIVEVGETREFEKFGKSGRVATATAKDATGEVKLTLWNEDIDKVKPGNKIHIQNGYVGEFQGEKQLTTGKFGTMEVVEAGKSEETAEDAQKPEVSGTTESGKPTEEPVKEAPEEDVDEEEIGSDEE